MGGARVPFPPKSGRPGRKLGRFLVDHREKPKQNLVDQYPPNRFMETARRVSRRDIPEAFAVVPTVDGLIDMYPQRVKQREKSPKKCFF
jgi:hypothetical protein